MRVAIVTAWYPSNENPLYGVFIQNQAQALSRHCEVVVILLTWSLVPYERQKEENGVKVIEKGDFYFPNANEHLLNFWAWRYVRFFKKIHKTKSFDLIHCHDHYGAFVGEKIKRKLGIPYLCTIHNSNIMNDKLPDWKKAYLPRILRSADRVVSVSKRLADKLRSRYKVESVRIIPNYVDVEKFDFRPERRQDDFRFIFVGGLEDHKGVEELVHAFQKAKIPNTSLHIVGVGYLEDKLRAYVAEHGLKDKVVLHGKVANEDIPQMYNASHVCVSVSEYETFGVAVLEAMLSGLPILYTASGGPEELVDDLAGIKVEDRSVESICRGLLEMKSRFLDFDGRAIREGVVSRFGSEKVIDMLLNEYKMVVDAKA